MIVSSRIPWSVIFFPISMRFRTSRRVIRRHTYLNTLHCLQILLPNFVLVLPLGKVVDWLPCLWVVVDEMAIVASCAAGRGVEVLARDGAIVDRFLCLWVDDAFASWRIHHHWWIPTELPHSWVHHLRRHARHAHLRRISAWLTVHCLLLHHHLRWHHWRLLRHLLPHLLPHLWRVHHLLRYLRRRCYSSRSWSWSHLG